MVMQPPSSNGRDNTHINNISRSRSNRSGNAVTDAIKRLKISPWRVIFLVSILMVIRMIRLSSEVTLLDNSNDSKMMELANMPSKRDAIVSEQRKLKDGAALIGGNGTDEIEIVRKSSDGVNNAITASKQTNATDSTSTSTTTSTTTTTSTSTTTTKTKRVTLATNASTTTPITTTTTTTPMTTKRNDTTSTSTSTARKVIETNATSSSSIKSTTSAPQKHRDGKESQDSKKSSSIVSTIAAATTSLMKKLTSSTSSSSSSSTTTVKPNVTTSTLKPKENATTTSTTSKAITSTAATTKATTKATTQNTTTKGTALNSTTSTTTTMIEEESFDVPSSKIRPFRKQEGVVIVTKIQDINHWDAVRQSFCLLHYAYNNRPLYDIVVFTADTIPQDRIAEVQAIVAPAKLTVVIDNPGLHTMIRAIPEAQRRELLERCNVTSVEDMGWYTDCMERGNGERLAYTWQAEFRSLHLWNQPALAQYRYMFWLDTDAFCTRVWKRDPIAYAIKHQLVMFFMNFPQGRSKGPGVPDRVEKAFGRRVCDTALGPTGHLVAKYGDCEGGGRIRQVHGFFHITDLTFFRSDPVMHWARTLIGDDHFRREFDDQVAVTVPTAVLASNRTWHMANFGFKLDVFHNGRLDGKEKAPRFRYTRIWAEQGETMFPEAYGHCNITNGD